jgi:hypothetical protein
MLLWIELPMPFQQELLPSELLVVFEEAPAQHNSVCPEG